MSTKIKLTDKGYWPAVLTGVSVVNGKYMKKSVACDAKRPAEGGKTAKVRLRQSANLDGKQQPEGAFIDIPVELVTWLD